MSAEKIRCHLVGGPSDGARFTHAPRVTTIKIPAPTSLGFEVYATCQKAYTGECLFCLAVID